MPILIDSHEDLAYNILSFGRDYTLPVTETRASEKASQIPARNGNTLLGWPDYQRGQVAIVFGTLFSAPRRKQAGDWDAETYADIDEAHQRYSAQLDVYHRLTDDQPDKFRLVLSQNDLQSVLDHWQNNMFSEHPVGLVPLMEGAEGVRQPEELEDWWQRGVRMIGLAWTGTRFCGGTRQPGPLTSEGYALLEAMGALGFALDLSHMDVKAATQALDVYDGTVIASHANAAALLKDNDSNRHLPDEVISGLIERNGVIGIIPYNRFLMTGWKRGDRRELVPLGHVAAQIDYICQMAGDALHVGIGSDFDGGFGVECAPDGVDTIADLQQLATLLAEKGYAEQDIDSIFSGNWLSILKLVLPEVS